MSTKIYDAYRFNGKPSELLEILRAFRKAWKEFHVRRIVNYAPSTMAYKELRDAIREESTKPHPSWDDAYDVRGSVVIYFHESEVYFQTFLQSHGNAPKLESPLFEDFHYQNQSDPWYAYEEGMSEQDTKKAEANYELRKNVWDAIFTTDCSSPIEAGVSYELCSLFDCLVIAKEAWELIHRDDPAPDSEPNRA